MLRRCAPRSGDYVRVDTRGLSSYRGITGLEPTVIKTSGFSGRSLFPQIEQILPSSNLISPVGSPACASAVRIAVTAAASLPSTERPNMAALAKVRTAAATFQRPLFSKHFAKLIAYSCASASPATNLTTSVRGVLSTAFSAAWHSLCVIRRHTTAPFIRASSVCASAAAFWASATCSCRLRLSCWSLAVCFLAVSASLSNCLALSVSSPVSRSAVACNETDDSQIAPSQTNSANTPNTTATSHISGQFHPLGRMLSGIHLSRRFSDTCSPMIPRATINPNSTSPASLTDRSGSATSFESGTVGWVIKFRMLLAWSVIFGSGIGCLATLAYGAWRTACYFRHRNRDGWQL